MTTARTPSVDDDTAIELWGCIIKGFQVTNKLLHVDLAEKFGLNEAEVETMLTLHREQEHRAALNTLTRATAFSTGGFTKIADKLSERNLTKREASETDRRVTYLTLTEEGRKFASRLAAYVGEANRNHFVDVLGVERAHMVAAAMTDLYRASVSTQQAD